MSSFFLGHPVYTCMYLKSKKSNDNQTAVTWNNKQEYGRFLYAKFWHMLVTRWQAVCAILVTFRQSASYINKKCAFTWDDWLTIVPNHFNQSNGCQHYRQRCWRTVIVFSPAAACISANPQPHTHTHRHRHNEQWCRTKGVEQVKSCYSSPHKSTSTTYIKQ